MAVCLGAAPTSWSHYKVLDWLLGPRDAAEPEAMVDTAVSKAVGWLTLDTQAGPTARSHNQELETFSDKEGPWSSRSPAAPQAGSPPPGLPPKSSKDPQHHFPRAR